MFGRMSGLALALMLALPGGGSAAEVTLRLHHFLPAESIEQTEVLEPWARRIEHHSDGRIAIEIFPDMALGGTPAELYDQARSGTADLVLTMPGHTPGRFPLIEVFELPFMAASAEATSQAVSKLALGQAAHEFDDVYPLLFHVHAPASLHMAGGRVRALEDLQNVKVYAPNAPAAAALEALGAVPVRMEGARMRHALARHRVTGGAFALSLADALEIEEIPRRHIIAPGLYTSIFMLVMNRDRYDRLPDDLKAVIDAHSGPRLAAEAGRVWDRAEVAAMETIEDEGFFVLGHLELERWRVAAQPAIDAWVEEAKAQGYDGETLLGHARALLAEFAGRS